MRNKTNDQHISTLIHTAINWVIAQLEKNAILRTCREILAADQSLSSGMHWIDPDGQEVGDSPIYVYCDMTSGFKFVIFTRF